MVRHTMMFGPIVGSVFGSWMPVVAELALGVMAPQPVELHVHCFGVSWLDVVGDNAMGCAVVSLDRCGRLIVAHLFKEVLHGDCFKGINVKGTKFGFGCTGHDGLEYFGNVEHGTIVGWVINVGQAEKVAANSTFCCVFAEV
jgi:hypothetical protein